MADQALPRLLEGQGLAPLARRFAEARTAAGLTREEVAERLGVGRATVLRWERGTLSPPEALVSAIAELLGVDVALSETNAGSIPRLRAVSGGAAADAAAVGRGEQAFDYGEITGTVELAPYVVNGPPDQREFHDGLVARQEHVTQVGGSWDLYRRRLSLVSTADGQKTAQALLERPRATAVSWSSNYGSHGWHRYVGRFPPHLVRALLNGLGANADTLVCDPFAGSGTTLVECRLLGVPAVGMEISPLSALISRTKACFPEDSAGVRRLAGTLDAFFAEAAMGGVVSASSHEEVLDRPGNLVPAFPNVERWFTPEALLGVSLVAEFAAQLGEEFEKDALLVALSAKMRSIGNVDVDVVRAEYRKEPRQNVDVRALVIRHLQKMADGIDASLKSHEGLIGPPDSITVREGDLLQAPVPDGSVSHIITSPPYGVESLSYFRTHLLSFRALEPFLDQDPYVVGAGVIGSEYLDDSHATTAFPKAERSQAYARFFAGLDVDGMASNERRRATMMMKFFEDMAHVGERFAAWLANDGRAVFVIGNKKLGDSLVPTAEIVSELFADQGLVLETQFQHKLKTNNSNSVVPWQERIINDEYVLIFRRED